MNIVFALVSLIVVVAVLFVCFIFGMWALGIICAVFDDDIWKGGKK